MRMSGNITTLCAARWSSTKPTAEEDAGAEFSEVGENIYSSLRRVQIHRQEDPRANVRCIRICCKAYWSVDYGEKLKIRSLLYFYTCLACLTGPVLWRVWRHLQLAREKLRISRSSHTNLPVGRDITEHQATKV